MSSIAEQAAGIVGLVLLLHTSKIELPNRHPWNCVICSSVWIAIIDGLVGLGSQGTLSDFIFRIGLTALFSGVTIQFAPTLFREFE